MPSDSGKVSQNNQGRVLCYPGLGVALFAPGWVYEGYTGDWRLLNEQLWSSLADVLGPPHAIISELPFVTSFCPGVGTAVHNLVLCHCPFKII